MPRKPKTRHPIRELRRVLRMTQPGFGERIGISGDYVKKIENRVQALPARIARLIQDEAGVDAGSLLKGRLRSVFRVGDAKAEPYTKLDYENWHKKQDHTLVRERALDLAAWIEILLVAAARPQKRKFWQVWRRIVGTLDECRGKFRLEQAVDEVIQEYHPPTDKVRQSDIDAALSVGWSKEDLPRVGDPIPLAWSPESNALTKAWLKNVIQRKRRSS